LDGRVTHGQNLFYADFGLAFLRVRQVKGQLTGAMTEKKVSENIGFSLGARLGNGLNAVVDSKNTN
jgi:hypothetical protein